MDWDKHIKLVEEREQADRLRIGGEKRTPLNYVGSWDIFGVELSTGLKINNSELWELLSKYKYLSRLSNVVYDGKCLLSYKHKKMQRCLELGCDWGHCFSVFESYFEEVYGIEIQKWAADRGIESGYNIVYGTMEHTPYNDNFFDVVLSSHVLEHGISSDLALVEIHRITKDQGWSIHTIPCRCDLSLNDVCEDSIHQSELTWLEWSNEFVKAGFKIDKLYWSWNNNQEEINIIARKL